VARSRPGELHAVARQQIEAPREMLAHALDVRCAPVRERVEHQCRAEVHRRAVVGLLEIEEHRIQWAQAFHAGNAERSGRRAHRNAPAVVLRTSPRDTCPA
jgi:hypothetical protein